MAELERDEQNQSAESESNEQNSSEQEGMGRSGRGFAGMSEEKRRAIASQGGKSQGKDNNPGNFANDREKAVAAGRAGGHNSHGGGRTGPDSDATDSIE